MKELWPNSPQTSVMMDNEEVLQEIVKHPGSVTHSLVTTESEEKQVNVSKVMDIQRYSNVTRLLRITAYVLRFINNVKQRILHRNNHDKTAKSLGKELEAQEMNRVETLWIKDVQETSFAKELELRRRNLLTNSQIYVIQLGLFLDEQGIIRCKGRLNNAPLSQSSKTPVLLSNKHELSNLVIQDVHSKIKHSGIKDTLTTIRERFWILRGREAVKQILRKCVTCRKVEGVPYRPPTTQDLPIERVSRDPSFTHTGLDFAGPLYIRDGNTVTEKGDNKVYICFFTRASTRAIHLELTPAQCQSLSVDISEIRESKGSAIHTHVRQCKNIQDKR